MRVDEALKILKEKGYKTTGKREEMLSYLYQHPHYISVKEVIDFLKEQYPGLSYDTVYRNLALFSELGILEETELEGEKRYQVNCSIDHHHHHLICLECGKSQKIDNCPMDRLPEFDNFTVTGHRFEIFGYCVKCQ